MYVSFYEINFFSREIGGIDRFDSDRKIIYSGIIEGGKFILYCTQIA